MNALPVVLIPPFFAKYKQFPTSLRNLRFLCEATDLPGATIHTNTRPGYGAIARSEMAGQMDYQPVNLQILCTDYMREKELFDDWIFSVKNAHSSRQNGGIGGTFDNAYYNNVVVDCGIYLLSNYGAVGSTLTLSTVPNVAISLALKEHQQRRVMLFVSLMYIQHLLTQFNYHGQKKQQ